MPAALDYLVVYDITADPERAQASRILEGVGVRVQESVFVCRLGGKALRKLADTLRAQNFQTGFLLIYTVRNIDKTLSIGARPGPAPENQTFIR
jgi:CRISPR-associated endonuclease Cas2